MWDRLIADRVEVYILSLGTEKQFKMTLLWVHCAPALKTEEEVQEAAMPKDSRGLTPQRVSGGLLLSLHSF